jgi:HD superfamily phosphohydrolase YqeK
MKWAHVTYIPLNFRILFVSDKVEKVGESNIVRSVLSYENPNLIKLIYFLLSLKIKLDTHKLLHIQHTLNALRRIYALLARRWDLTLCDLSIHHPPC